MLFLPLENDCEVGRGAAILTSMDVQKMREVLMRVEDRCLFPAEAVSHALLRGVSFPFASEILKLEEMDNLIQRMAKL